MKATESIQPPQWPLKILRFFLKQKFLEEIEGDMEEIISNKVSESGIITIDLEHFFPEEEIAAFDLTPFLFRGLILKEKEFRESILKENWSKYAGKSVAVFC